MRNYAKAVRFLLGLTLVLGIITILTIRVIVPFFVVELASTAMVFYFIALVWLLTKNSRRALILTAALSILTISALLSTNAHIQLIEQGYLPAVVIITSGIASQVVLLILSVLAYVRK